MPLLSRFYKSFAAKLWLKAWPVLVMLCLWLVFWWPVIQGEKQLYIRDLTFYALPMKTYMMARFHAGEFPFWTPHISTGMPFFAEPTHQVLYPFNILFFFTPTVVHGISWFVILHLLLAQVAFYMLCRVLGFNRWLSLWGGLLFGYAGYTISIGDNVNYLPAVLWCPLALATFIRGLQTGHFRYSVWTAICIAMMLFAGDTFNPLFLGVFFVLMLLCRWKVAAFGEWLRGSSDKWALWHLGVSFALAGLLAAVQILPTQELLALSVRQAPLALGEVTLWSFPPERVVELIQPYFYGSKYPAPHFIGQFMYPKFREPWADSVYLGIIPAFFAVLALVFQFRRHFYWGMVALSSLLVSFGTSAPYYTTLLKIFPPLSYHRYQEKLVFWVILALCVLAVCGVHYVVQNRAALLQRFMQKSRSSQIGWVLGLVVFGTLLLCKIPIDLWIWPHALENSLEWGRHFYEREPHVLALYTHWFLLILPLCLFPWLIRQWAAYLPLLLVVAVLDLYATHWGQLPSAPTTLLTQRPTPAALKLIRNSQPKGPIRIFFDDSVELIDRQDEAGILRRISEAYGVPPIEDNHDVYWIYRFLYNQNRLLFNFGSIYNVGYQNGRFEPLQQKRHKLMDDVLMQHQPVLLPALCAVPYIVSTVSPVNTKWNPDEVEVIGEDQGFNLRILKVKKAVSRAYIAPNAIYNPKPETYFKILTQPFLSHDYQQQVEVAALPPGRVGSKNLVPLNPNAKAQIVRDTHERIEIAVDSPYTGPDTYLVLAESLFPGWKATVDDRPAPVYLANQRFMAVPLPPGRHRVVFQYHSTHFTAGLLLSLLGGLLAVGFCVFPGKKRA
jgi:hypothetical protein